MSCATQLPRSASRWFGLAWFVGLVVAAGVWSVATAGDAEQVDDVFLQAGEFGLEGVHVYVVELIACRWVRL